MFNMLSTSMVEKAIEAPEETARPAKGKKLLDPSRKSRGASRAASADFAVRRTRQDPEHDERPAAEGEPQKARRTQRSRRNSQA